MVKIFILILLCFAIFFTAIFAVDYCKTVKEGKLENTNFFELGAVGFITSFFDTLGIGCFATTTALLKILRLTEDRTLPGTLNVGCTIPIVIEAVIFTTEIKVDIMTLVLMVAAATLGALIGAGFVAKLDEKKVQLGMGIALIFVMIIMLCDQFGMIPAGGTATGLSGKALIIGVIGNFILGALMTLGIGLYAPCLALVYALGMSPEVAFPIMMGSCAFLMTTSSVRFIKKGAYDKKASMVRTIFGSVGVFAAFTIVRTLPVKVLLWIVIIVVFYTSIIMLRSSLNNDHRKNFPSL